MARVEEVTVTYLTITCSVCGRRSNYKGQVAVEKWKDKDWYCHEHRPESSHIKPYCVCGHRKNHHYYRNGDSLKCKISQCNCKKYEAKNDA